MHTINGVPLKVPTDLQHEIKGLFKNMLGLKKRGTNLFFTDIDKLKEKMLEEIKWITNRFKINVLWSMRLRFLDLSLFV